MTPMPSPYLSPEPFGGFLPDGTSLDFSHTGVAWLDVLIDVLVTVTCVFGAVTAFYFKFLAPKFEEIRKNIKRAAADAAVAREHTENSHANAPNPNLRDDLDAKHAKLHENFEAMSKMMQSIINGQMRNDKELARINDTLLADREATREVSEKLDAHMREGNERERRLTKVEYELQDHREITEPDRP